MALQRRVNGVDLAELNAEVSRQGVFAAEYPEIVDFLVLTAWPDDGAVRYPGTLLVFQQDGYLKACLKDPNTGEVAFWASESIQGLLALVNRDLKEGRGDWRKERSARKGK